MGFRNFINLVKLGITGVIEQRLFEKDISVNVFNNSIWEGVIEEQPVALQQPQQIQSTALTEDESSVPQRINLQDEYPELPFDANGDVDFNELTIDKLKTRFPESEYIIEITSENNDEVINIKSKNDGKFILSCVNTSNFKGEKVQFLSFEYNGILTQLTYQDGEFSRRTTFHIEGDDYFFDTQENFDENGQLISRKIWNEDNTSYKEQIYSKGILCRETTFTKTGDSYFDITSEIKVLSDKLVQDIVGRMEAYESRIGFLPKADDIENDILNGISKNNVMIILSDYKETTGRELIQDIIDNEIGLDYETQKELLVHLTSLVRVSLAAQYDNEHYIEGKSLGQELQFALKNSDKEMLKETLEKVNKDNIEYVLNNIYKITGDSTFTDFSDKLYSQLLSVLGIEDGKYITKFAKSMIEHINENGGYTKDILEDWNSYLNSYSGTIINFTRLTNRCQAGHSSTIEGKPDGKIDIDNIKQGGTGDCWLIASILSATNKNQKGLDYINSMLSVDSYGNVTVELKGVNRKYVISAEEIEKSNHLASGDPDMRAIEIAIDRYIKGCAYIKSSDNFDFSHVDINGDLMDFAYNILFGNGCYYGEFDVLSEDFNHENQIYSIFFDVAPGVKATVLGSVEQLEVNLLGKHAYAIKGSDENYIYLINPHNSSQILQVEKALIQPKNPRVYFAQIDKNAVME